MIRYSKNKIVGIFQVENFEYSIFTDDNSNFFKIMVFYSNAFVLLTIFKSKILFLKLIISEFKN